MNLQFDNEANILVLQVASYIGVHYNLTLSKEHYNLEYQDLNDVVFIYYNLQ